MPKRGFTIPLPRQGFQLPNPKYGVEKHKNQETLHPVRHTQIRAAGEIANTLSKQRAFQRMVAYNVNPNHCLQCSAALLIPLEKLNRTGFQQTKKKKFCNQSCGAKYNMARTLYPRNQLKIRTCTDCGSPFTKTKEHRSDQRCQPCVSARLTSTLPLKTKAECCVEDIRRHARTTLFSVKPKVCQVCGYSFHADACHIKPIKTFTSTALVGEINALSNLAALCKNHHDELDKGALTL